MPLILSERRTPFGASIYLQNGLRVSPAFVGVPIQVLVVAFASPTPPFGVITNGFLRTTTGAQKGYTVQVIFRSQLKTSAGAVANGVTDAEGYVNVYPKVFVSARFSHAATQKFQPYPVKPLRILGSSKVKKLHPNHLIFADLIGF